MSPSSTDDFGVPSVNPAGETPVYLSRREARAAREAAEKGAPATAMSVVPAVAVSAEVVVTSEIAVPAIPSAPVAVAHSVTPAPYVPTAFASSAPSRIPAALKPKTKRARTNPLRAVASMAVIGGLFAVAGLPAYSASGFMSDEGVVTAASASTSTSALGFADVKPASVQSVTVSAELDLPVLERDQFSATSPEDLEQIRQQAAIAEANSLYVASGAQALGDDYPWPTADDTLSPLNYYYRQCTDFVAWRLNRDVGSFAAPFRWAWSDLTPNGGDAYQWKSAWEAHGWTVSDAPVAGAVAWFGWDNHVAYVKQVNSDGSVLLEEYNYVYRSYGQRTLQPSEVEAFLYPPGQ
ncbi:CHAP domain-containing protein [Salinibacterium sp. SWN1162]|uniref:CHAP domain-containing protein n=1 Tax=Salinibacterium sp. SWN1162 TaxID=2792053 RepID=UPI0018CDBE33|nr:CHAP domain-containing protein [Salinibacterium sp. SWN1162]MBH0008675.1 CHAP domain-containing protein [Salinibacterium sp. SWN1162]